RLFREFAVTISMTILISGIVSLTLTPMLGSRLLRSHHGEHHNWLYRVSEAGFNGLLHLYAVTLRGVIRWRRTTLFATILSVVAAGYLYVAVPKGFFPIEDTGMIFAITEAAQDTSFQAISDRQKAVAAIVQANSAVEALNSSVGAVGFSPQ